MPSLQRLQPGLMRTTTILQHRFRVKAKILRFLEHQHLILILPEPLQPTGLVYDKRRISTFLRTKYILSVIMCLPSVPMGRLIPIPPKRYALYYFNKYCKLLIYLVNTRESLNIGALSGSMAAPTKNLLSSRLPRTSDERRNYCVLGVRQIPHDLNLAILTILRRLTMIRCSPRTF